MNQESIVIHRRHWLAYGCFIGLITMLGCSGNRGPSSGRVLFTDGTPVQSGSIEFRNVAGRELFTSRIESDGRFAPQDQEGRAGLPPGTYDAVVVQIVLTEDLAKEHHTHGHTVPRRYADYHTSQLRVTIAPASQEIPLIEIEPE